MDGIASICLVSPGHVGSNPRLVKEADALTAVGYNVRAVAVNLDEMKRRSDQALIARRLQCAFRKFRRV
jgi:hypothetical protein